MSTYLVTGGAGFIGSHITETLVKRGQRVRVFDNFSTGKRKNLDGFSKDITLIKGDIRDLNSLRKAFKGVDFILHQAALRSVPKSIDDPISYDEVNIRGTLNVLLAAKEAKAKRVVLASSSSIYGETTVFPQREDAVPKLISPYAATKLAGEYYCRVFSKSYGLETVSLRYFNVFGPRQSLDSEYAVVVPKFIASILRDVPPPVHGDGKQTRDFTYISNVVEANINSCVRKGVSGEVINVACGKAYSILDIVKTVNAILGKEIKPLHTSPRQGDVRRTFADITKLKRLLKMKSFVSFEEGLEKTVRWFNENKNTLHA